MKAVAVAGGSPDTPKAPETEGTELPETQNTPPEDTPRPTTPTPDPTQTAPGDAAGAGSKGGPRDEPAAEAEPEPPAETQAEADAVRKAGRAEGASDAPVATADAVTEVAGAVGTGPDEGAPAESAARSEDESLADDAQGAGSTAGTRGEPASASDPATAEAATDAVTEVAGAIGTGPDEGAPAGLAAQADADADLEAEHVAEAAEAEAEAGETAPAPGTAAAQGDVPAPGAKGTGAAVSDPAADAIGEDVPEGKEAAKTEDKGAGGAVSDPGTAAADGGVAQSGAVVGDADAPGPEADGADVSDDEADGADVSDDEVGDADAPGPETDGADASGPEADGGEVRDAGAGGEGRDADAAAAHDEPSAEAGDGAGRVPSWARDDDTDAERTSQFVALKDLDAPAEKAPWPRALAPNRTPGRNPAPTDTPTPAPNPSRAAGLAPGRDAGPVRTPSAPAPTSAPAPAGPAPVVEPTREVPVPPRPPLDLLAELTNNPPPPETPRRTAVRRVKIWTPILLLLAGAAIGGQLLRPLPAPRIVAAEQTHTLDGQFSVPWPAKGQGTVRVPGSGDIGAFGEQKPVPTASVAKVMTAYVILKNHPLRKAEAGPQIEVDAKAVADGTSDNESRIVGLVAGTKFSQQDMLKMLMIPSGNNVARLLARWDTGTDSEAAFVEKMNAAARELGMRNTTYTDPSGLDAATVSTAADQLKLAEAVMKDEAFRAVVALPSAEIKGLSDTLINNNTLLSVNGLSVRGIKTGSSTPAGGTLMWAAYKSVGDETPLILGTLMDQHADGPDRNGENSLKLVLANSKKIIESVRQALDSAPVVRKGQTVGHVDDGLGGRTPLVATKDLKVIGVPGQQLQLALRPGASGTPHAAKAGSEVGVLTVGTGEGAKTVPVALGTDLAEPSFTTRVTRLR
ncbi:D-alanyl-D-alanine carboxypeptidase [Streptomyces vinaceus]|uniref:D-alanyl-D-alanine carboxypeptidase n=1 Tax=Streptomyces vinaceus TaxID=1960 RepID=UPI0037F31E15